MYFFSMTLLPILRRIQLPTELGHYSQAKYENSRKIIFITVSTGFLFVYKYAYSFGSHKH